MKKTVSPFTDGKEKIMKKHNKLALLFATVYMVSYITRINFGTIISEMEAATQISRSLLSMSITGSFITYGVGQVLSGICGDKFSPKHLIMYGLIATITMNLLIPFCQNPYQMLGVWCINGFAQSFMWPPMVKLLVILLNENEYKKACTKVSYGSSAGTIALYLISPLLISYLGWRSVFFFSAMCGIIMIFVWNKFCPGVKYEAEVKIIHKEKGKGSVKMLLAPTMLSVMLAIILQGMLRDGVQTWMPTYISDVYKMSNIISILSGVILPLFSIFSFNVATKLYMTKFTNPIACAGVFFGAGVISSAVIYVFSGQSAVVSVIMFAILTGSMHGVNLMLIAMLPQYFKSTGKVSMVSGVLNFCTYIGSAVSTYGIAVISESMGWSFTVLQWCIIEGLGTALCLVTAKPKMRKLS